MNEVSETHLSARVDVPASESLEILSGRLSQLMPGLTFRQESTGRYEEVPAFVAESGNLCFALLGVPEGEHADTYVLEFDCTTDLPIDALIAGDAGGFIRQFVSEKPLEQGMFMDFSEELARLLVQRGIPGCKPILLQD